MLASRPRRKTSPARRPNSKQPVAKRFSARRSPARPPTDLRPSNESRSLSSSGGGWTMLRPSSRIISAGKVNTAREGEDEAIPNSGNLYHGNVCGAAGPVRCARRNREPTGSGGESRRSGFSHLLRCGGPEEIQSGRLDLAFVLVRRSGQGVHRGNRDRARLRDGLLGHRDEPLV